MKIKVRAMDVPMNVIIDTDDLSVRKALTDAGLTFPPEKKVEPVEFKITDGQGYIEQTNRVPYIAEIMKGACPHCRQLVIQANFAKWCLDYIVKTAPEVKGERGMRPVLWLLCEIYDHLEDILKGV